ncbi:bacteriohemerythrin [Pararhodospirillum oryzae]|uniref:Methyl-accepting chemotaxis protein n=1 Tax=Pararhodospirillum oryzae TaxID=478448 RepID=A0A512H400_9PROT|nr:bacteriohemerythrin [Pararhodospirillum oryzae]GEO80185.1 methyl-accepting chemotaxis protein [Pararhodospirillum oryzae]
MGEQVVINRFSIGTRVFAGFAVVLLLLLGVAFQGATSGTSALSAFREYARIATNTMAIRGIDRNINALRRHALTYGYYGDTQALKRVRDYQGDLDKKLDSVIGAVRIETVRDMLGRMKEHFDSYMRDFDQVEKLRQQRDAYYVQAREKGPRMVGALTDLMERVTREGDLPTLARLNAVYEAFSQARLAMVFYQLSPRDNKPDQALAALDQALVLLKQAQAEEADFAHRKALDQLVADFPAYIEVMTGQTKALMAYSRLIDEVMPAKAALFGDLARDAANAQADALEALLAHSESDLETARSLGIGLSGVALVLGVLAAVIIIRTTSVPVRAMTEAMRKLADGDKTITIPSRDAKDEIGAMAQAVQVFKENAIRVEHLQREQEAQKQRADEERKAAVRQMADTFEASVGQVVETVTSAATQLQAASAQMAATARETSAQATTVAASAEEASNNVNTVAAAAEELASSEGEISQHIHRSSTVADQAAHQAHTTHTTVEQMVEAVGKIGEIVTLINDIASQTNLLALNATIEAARAGDAGKGFAVVASEVKTLATQTARATDEIASQISRVQAVTNEAARAIEAVSETITEIDQIANSIAAAVEQQTAATSEIARNVDQASQGTREVSHSILIVQEAANETGHSADEIAGASANLSRQAEFLREEVKRFLDQVRADDTEKVLLEWDQALEVGLPVIDNHHRDMVNEINGYYQDLITGRGNERIPSMLLKVIRTFEDHFREEETMMREISYPGLEEHRKVHQDTLREIVVFKERLDRGEDIVMPFFHYLANWLREHLTTHDIRMAHYANQHHRRRG